MVKPGLENMAQGYAGQVDLWEMSADENQDLLHQLKVYSIPALIGCTNGEVLSRCQVRE